MNFFDSVANLVPEFRDIATHPGTAVSGLSRVHKAHFTGALFNARKESNLPLLVLTETENEAMRLCDDINALFNLDSTVYPAKDFNLIAANAQSPEYEHRRLSVLTQLSTVHYPLSTPAPTSLSIVISTAEAAAQLTLSPKELADNIITISKDDELNVNKLLKSLTENGYTRVDMVESAAQFSVRGSVIDIYPVNSLPVRIDLWGDTVYTMMFFDIDSQRSVEKITGIRIAPAVELKPEQTGRATLFDYVGDIIVCEHNACNEQFRAAHEQLKADIELLLESGKMSETYSKLMLSKSEYESIIKNRAVAYLNLFAAKGGGKGIVSVSAVQVAGWNGDYKQLIQDLSGYIKSGYALIVFAGTEKNARSLALDLRDDGFPADYSENPKKVYAKHIFVTKGSLSGGFDYPQAKCACISCISARSHNDRNARNSADFATPQLQTPLKKAKRKSKSEAIRAITEINVGDYIVHDNYGIGVFEGVTKLTTDNVSKDYIKLQYAGKDVLYVPVTQLDYIARYIGNTETASLKLSKLNTDGWFKARAKAKKAAEELAQKLIELYSRRMRSEGHKFAEDTREQEEFENRFNYIETDDQLNCIKRVKKEMQSDRPMDILLCGDVGYGKTEVALRGAFKCVMEGMQCALLCPTTVLAWQHYQTAVQRMEGFPVNIELLSRFRTAKEQREVLQKLQAGIVDFIIGTHTLIGKSVKFKNLGLVIIDEEQRFGVTQKEKLKDAFSGVDVLTLSATPIPRTLNMAMSGIRDICTIDTPPHDRIPVTTYVIEQDDGVIAGAINKELRRAGQVYYVHNRVETIMSQAAKLQQLVPEAKIGIAHGRMEERELLSVWRKLLEREIDILVCTTLIETGIDVPNVNTLIIENADRMGLAQLHQLRGRVGRTNRRAYAYFTYKRGKVLSEIAEKRLTAVKDFTQFGAGFKIALRDLEIRGAGSVLGESQSGHLSAVGYETYVRLLEEAVNETMNKNSDEENIPVSQCTVDIKADAYLPDDYIFNHAQRIDCYKKIAEIRDEDDAADVTDELTDRYGRIPKSVRGLIDAARIRNMAGALGISDITQNKAGLVMCWENPNLQALSKLPEEFSRRIELNMTGKVGITLRIDKGDDVLGIAAEFLGRLTV